MALKISMMKSRSHLWWVTNTGRLLPAALETNIFLTIVSLLVSSSVENVQSHLLTSRNLVSVRLRGVDLHGNGKNTDYFRSCLNEMYRCNLQTEYDE